MPPAQDPSGAGSPSHAHREKSSTEQFGLSEQALALELEYLDVDQSMASARGVVLPYSILLVALLALMLPYSPPEASLVWAASFATYILARHRMNQTYARRTVAERKAHLRAWHRTMISTSIVFGAVWGSAVVIAFPGAPLELKLLWTMALTMVVAGAPRLLTMPQFLVLVATMLVFSCVAWLDDGGWLGVPMAVALTLLGGLFVIMARHFHRGLREKFELQLRNEHLARELASRNTILEQTAQARTMLLAAASHDLRQPVHALGLLMEVIQRTSDPQVARQRLDMASDCVESLSEMLTKLLDFTRMDSGHFLVHRRAIPLQDTLDDAMRTLGATARRKGLMMRVTPTPLWVNTDPHLLRRMVFNLVSNAIKYTEYGSVQLHIERTPQNVILHVEDTGMGIAPNRLKHIFADYVTSDQPSTRFDAGIGLGLGIVRRCAQLLQLSVTVRSQPGEGSCFSIHLGAPVEPDTNAPTGAPPESKLSGVVAVVENDPAILEGLREMLSEWGFVPVAGSTPGHVQHLLSQSKLRPHVILSDLHLGLSVTGFDAIASLRLSTGMAHVPAVILTGDLSPDHLRLAEARDIRLEHKPMRPARLRELLEGLVEIP